MALAFIIYMHTMYLLNLRTVLLFRPLWTHQRSTEQRGLALIGMKKVVVPCQSARTDESSERRMCVDELPYCIVYMCCIAHFSSTVHETIGQPCTFVT